MRYIDSDKLIASIEEYRDRSKRFILKASDKNLETTELANRVAADTYNIVLSMIASLRQGQQERVWIHKKYNREYRIVSDNARLKDSDGKWIDCVIYAPLYENEFEMFAREKDSFYKEFEKK